MTARLLVALVVLASLIARGEVASTGHPSLFNDGWRFALSDDSLASRPDYDDSDWRSLSLPHDWSIEAQMSPTLASCTGYMPGGIGWYRKTFVVTDSLPCHYVYFEGVYNRSDVYINGHHLGHRPNGYASMMYDLTPYLSDGDNVLAVRVDHSRYADSRWYTGSGIYRDVYLIAAPETHFAQWGVGWRAVDITPRQATVVVDADIVNPYKGLIVSAVLTDADGRVVAKSSAKPVDGRAEVSLKVKSPRLWSIDEPNLYGLRVTLADGKTLLDVDTMRVGIRTLHFDPDTGFALNGVNTKVRGVCMHHDAGVLGAAVPRDVWHRRLVNLKAMGANAIRMSHNPQAPMVYDLCDELGLLVMDEASDEWEFPKRKWLEGWNKGTPGYDGTYDFFEEWIDRDVADMVRRDRNHPSIFLWSVGNEVDYPNDPYSHPILDGDSASINQPMYGGYNPAAPRAERIGVIAKRLAKVIRSIDTSRPTTGAMAGVLMSNQTDYPRAIDVCGYNYTENRYAEDHAAYPDRVIYGSENGVGYDAWRAVRDNDYIFGQFVWTGLDYLGESGRWPSRGLHTGLLDFGGFLKPRGHFRASLWSDHPVCYIGAYPVPSPDEMSRWQMPDGKPFLTIEAPAIWNWDPGQPMRVVCYTNAPHAELYLDGALVGERKPYDQECGIIYWDIPFAPGVLKAVGIGDDGHPESEYAIATSGRPYALRATLDGPMPQPGGVAHILVEVLDDDGRLVPLADNNIACRVSGGELLGLENSDNRDITDHTDNRERAYRGRLLAYVRVGDEPVQVRFASPLLQPVQIALP